MERCTWDMLFKVLKVELKCGSSLLAKPIFMFLIFKTRARAAVSALGVLLLFLMLVFTVWTTGRCCGDRSACYSEV